MRQSRTGLVVRRARALVLMLFLALPGLTIPVADDVAAAGVGQLVPQRSLLDQFGNEHQLVSADQVTLIHACTLWCSPCRSFTQNDLPGLRDRLDASIGADSYRVIEILIEDQNAQPSNATSAQAWATHILGDPTEPVLHVNGDQQVLQDLYTDLEISVVPTFMIIDIDGAVLFHQGGTVSGAPNIERAMTAAVVPSPVIEMFTVPSHIAAGEETRLAIKAVDPAGRPLTALFDWGDGTETTVGLVDGQAFANHSYPTATSGVLQVSVSVSNGLTTTLSSKPLLITNPERDIGMTGRGVFGDQSTHEGGTVIGSAQAHNGRATGHIRVDLPGESIYQGRVIAVTETEYGGLIALAESTSGDIFRVDVHFDSNTRMATAISLFTGWNDSPTVDAQDLSTVTGSLRKGAS